MRITPLDIHHKKFKVSLRGYNEEEVDSFLDEIAGELDRVLKENNTLKEQTDQTKGKITEYQTMEQTLHATLLSAQKLADDVAEKAGQEAKSRLSEAKKEANKILSELAKQREEILSDIKRLKKIERQYKENMLGSLNSAINQINEAAELLDEKVIQKEEDINKKIEELIPELDEEPSEVPDLETDEEIVVEKAEEEGEEIQPSAEAEVEEAEAEVEAEIEEPEGEDESSAEDTVQPELEPEQNKKVSEESEGQEESPDFFSREISEEEKPSFADLGEGIPGVLGRRQAKKKKKK